MMCAPSHFQHGMPDALSPIWNISLFADLPDGLAEGLRPHLSERSYARREVVFNKGETSQFFYFLLEGRLQAVDFTVDGREAGLYFVDPGDYFGELSVIDGEPQAEFMIALTRSRVALMPRQEARALILSNPKLSERVLARVARRLRAATAQRTLLSLPNPGQRICAQLVQLAVPAAGGGCEIPLAPTHQELAIMINTSRETVTRAFQVLQARGVLRREDNRLILADLRYLNAVAEGAEELPKSA